MTGFIAFLFVVFLILSGKYIRGLRNGEMVRVVSYRNSTSNHNKAGRE